MDMDDHALNLDKLHRLSQPPPLWEPGEPLFWDDPHISAQMLVTHLDPTIEAASRPPDVIDRTVAWLIDYLELRTGMAALDLGCGPGLYCERLARTGLRVTGIDYSQRSITYARRSAEDQGLLIDYRYQDYLTLDMDAAFDVVLLIFGDLCVLPPDKRDSLLNRVRRALKPGGYFVCDVSTPRHHAHHRLPQRWYVSESGFWRPGLHLVLEQSFFYPEQLISLNQYVVIENRGQMTVYRNWFQDYTPDTITPVIEAHGFRVCGTWRDLAGTPYQPDSEWIGVVAQVQAAE